MLGFEQSFVLGEETEGGGGTVSRAILFSLGVVGLVLFIGTFAMVLGFGPDGMERLNGLFASDGTPWFALVRERIGSGWVNALELLIIVSILSNTIASTNSVVRILYGMGRAGALPRRLGRTLPGLRTPHVAIAVIGVFTVAASLLPGLIWSPSSVFGFMGFGIGFSAAVSFILIALAALRYFRRIPDDAGWASNYLAPIVAIAILIPVVITSFYPNPGPSLRWAPWVAIGWLLIGVAYLVARGRSGRSIDLDYAFADAGQGIPAEARATEPA